MAVVDYPEEINSSLEFKSYRYKFEEKFKLNGYTIAPEDSADYIALMSYGIDSGTEQTGVVSTLVYGQTGGWNDLFKRHYLFIQWWLWIIPRYQLYNAYL